MTALRSVWIARLRRRWPIWLALAVALGLAWGVVLATAAGARRTASAHDRFLTSVRASEVGTNLGSDPNIPTRAELQRIPGVVDASMEIGFAARPVGIDPNSLRFFLGLTEGLEGIDRPRLVSGRLPDPARLDEVLLNETAARLSGLDIGDSIDLEVFAPDFSSSRAVRVTVVGVAFLTDEVVEDDAARKSGVLLTPAFLEAHSDIAQWRALAFDIEDGLGDREVQISLSAAGLSISDTLTASRAKVQASTRPLVTILAALAAIGAVVALALATMALARDARRHDREAQALRALGVHRSGLVGLDVLTAVLVGVGAALVSIGAAVVASPVFPMGPVRRGDPARGIDVDAFVVAGGAATLVALIAACTAAWSLGVRRTRRRSGTARPGALGRLGFGPLPFVMGARLALSGRALSLAVTSGTLVAVIAVSMATTFEANLERLGTEPSSYGVSWDLAARNAYGDILVDEITDTVAAHADAAAAITYLATAVDGHPVPTVAVQPLKGDPWPIIVDGRAPRRDREILLGQRTLDLVGAEIGDGLRVDSITNFSFGTPVMGDPEQVLTVVGTAIFPAVALAGNEGPRLDAGMAVFHTALDMGEGNLPEVLYVDLADGVTPEEFQQQFPRGVPDGLGMPTEWLTVARPAEVIQVLEGRPALVAVVTLLGAAMLLIATLGLIADVRDGRRRYAVLSALGFQRRQITWTVLWQAVVTLVVPLVVGLPLGVAAGRVLWTEFADGIGLVSSSMVPVAWLAGTVVVAVVALEVLALLPARMLRSERPGIALRNE